MRVTAWLRAHWLAALAILLLAAWIVYRVAKSPSFAGHASPEDAISYGWSVFPAGIGGWLEVSPDESKSILHETGWSGDPFARL
jgi:hypothetical protein